MQLEYERLRRKAQFSVSVNGGVDLAELTGHR